MVSQTWQPAALPDNEMQRLEQLQHYAILDTVPESAFDRLTRMAARRFGMPISLLSLVDAQRQWFKSRHGIDVTETQRDLAFCAHAILQDEVMVVPDATKDPRFLGSPLVTGAPEIRFYAGAPLKNAQGVMLGTLCLIDRVPHPEFGEEEKKELAELAAIAMDEMELRLAIQRMAQDREVLEKARQQAEKAEQAMRAMQEKRGAFSTEEQTFLPISRAQYHAPPIDMERLAMVGDTPDEMRDVLALFFQMAAELVDEMQVSWRNEECERWRQAAHSLKGASANLGMAALEALCRQCEESSAFGSAPRSVWLQKINEELVRIRHYIARTYPALTYGEVLS